MLYLLALVSIAELDSLVDSSGGSRGHGSAEGSLVGLHICAIEVSPLGMRAITIGTLINRAQDAQLRNANRKSHQPQQWDFHGCR